LLGCPKKEGSVKVKVPIVILQPNEKSFLLCRKELTHAGFIEREDFLLFNAPESVEQHIVPGDPQIFVSGVFNNGDIKATVEFARQMKQKNPNLKIVAFSVCDMPGYRWDFSITKADTTDFCGQLIPELRKFVRQKV
jgi:hypothetical protein